LFRVNFNAIVGEVLSILARSAVQTTSITLLERLRSPGSSGAWDRFVELYTPLIFSWARKQGLQPDDAADLVQDVFTALIQELPTFQYDPSKSFRAWLHRVTVNLWHDRQRAAGTRALPGSDGRTAELVAPNHAAFLEDEEYRSYLVSRALKLMQTDFEPATWQAVWQHAVLERPAAEVARELNLTVASVYCAKSRVLNRLRQELQGLLE
jgi:RNA polymerase sigma-70 factor (ECF subfamily)